MKASWLRLLMTMPNADMYRSRSRSTALSPVRIASTNRIGSTTCHMR